MNQEKLVQQKAEITLVELQEFVNNPALDLPAQRRDISKPENVGWLIRNIWIRNKVPARIIDALKRIHQEKPERVLQTEQEWQAEYESLRKLRQQILAMVNGNKRMDGKSALEWFLDQKQVLKKAIEQAGYGKWQFLSQHVLWHSTPSYEWGLELDLPGELSVRKFYNDILKKLKA